MTGANMFAYCGNNPVNRVDCTGEIPLALFGKLCVAVQASIFDVDILNSPASLPWRKLGSVHIPFSSEEEAARAFAEETYSSSSYIRHE